MIEIVATMSDLKAKMLQIRLQLGLCPRDCWWSIQCSPGPIAGFRRTYFSRRGGKRKGWEGRGGKGSRGVIGMGGEEDIRRAEGKRGGRQKEEGRGNGRVEGSIPANKNLRLAYITENHPYPQAGGGLQQSASPLFFLKNSQ